MVHGAQTFPKWLPYLTNSFFFAGGATFLGLLFCVLSFIYVRYRSVVNKKFLQSFFCNGKIYVTFFTLLNTFRKKIPKLSSEFFRITAQVKSAVSSILLISVFQLVGVAWESNFRHFFFVENFRQNCRKFVIRTPDKWWQNLEISYTLYLKKKWYNY